jgi:ATP-binding cassette, subfamily B, bacterial
MSFTRRHDERNIQVPAHSLFIFLSYFIKRYGWWLLAMQIFCLGWALDHTLMPYVLGRVIDVIVNFSGDKKSVWQVLWIPLVLGAFLWVLTETMYRLAGIVRARVFPNLQAAIRMRMFAYIQQHSYQFFSNQLAGSMGNKINDMVLGSTRLLDNIIFLFIPVFVAVLITIGMFFWLQPLYAAIIGGWVALHVSICLGFSAKINRLSHINSEARSDLTGRVVDSFTNFINVKLFSRQRFEYQYINEFQQDEKNKQWQTLWFIEKVRLLLGIVAFIIPGVALTWAVLSGWQQDIITTGEVVFIFNTAWNVMTMVWITGMELPNFFAEMGSCQQALTLMKASHDIVDNPQAKPIQVTQGSIEFNRVVFQYHAKSQVLKDQSLIIPAGQKVGLVGFSGAGKSTFVNLILRLFELTQGQILIDGQNIAEVTQQSLREKISMIPQETVLFHRSIMENIRYGKEHASEQEVIAAVRQAHCHEFIENLPQQYDTLVGERGIKLSGGQRQRIAIARAFLADAPILILDEATASLDSMTEQLIQDSLQNLMADRTTIVIAHRLSTLRQMQRILVFKQGEIVEDGSHEQLMAREGYYAKLWQMQAHGFLPEQEMLV